MLQTGGEEHAVIKSYTLQYQITAFRNKYILYRYMYSKWRVFEEKVQDSVPYASVY